MSNVCQFSTQQQQEEEEEEEEDRKVRGRPSLLRLSSYAGN